MQTHTSFFFVQPYFFGFVCALESRCHKKCGCHNHNENPCIEHNEEVIEEKSDEKNETIQDNNDGENKE